LQECFCSVKAVWLRGALRLHFHASQSWEDAD
jgi:hypothetical protein